MSADAELHSIKILVVDDHPLMRAGVVRLLDGEPDMAVVAEAADGLSAVSLTIQKQPDVVLMDLSLPDLGGIEATQRILGELPSTRVLGLSAHEETAFAKRLLAVGAAGYALKRCAGDELVRAVRRVARGSRYVDPSLQCMLDEGAPSSDSMAASLSQREAEVLRLIAQGHTSREMAETLQVSPRTLETYRARALAKLKLRSRAELVRYAVTRGWLSDM